MPRQTHSPILPKTLKISVQVAGHVTAVKRMNSLTKPDDLDIDDVIERVVTLNDALRKFWIKADGWASIEASKLLKKSRLDWQVSLSKCLKIWVVQASGNDIDGRLILAWANLGSLTEGSMKLFLSAWYNTYKHDIDAIKKNNRLQDPDVLYLEQMRQFFRKKIWDERWDRWVQTIQRRRNAIHAFKSRDLGNHEEFIASTRMYLNFLRYINFRLPYPDGGPIPKEK